MPLQDKIPQPVVLFYLISLDALLDGLDPSLRTAIAMVEKQVSVRSNEIVFDSKDLPLQIYIHRRGQVALFQEGELKDIAFPCPAGPRCIYGLVEALSGTSYGATMKTLSASKFDVIDRDEFLRLIRDQPTLSFRLAEILSRLCQQSLNAIRSH